MLVKSILQKKKKREKKKEEAGEGREEEKRGGRREERSERRVCVRVRACACESVCLLVRVRVARADHERERDRKRGVHVARACMGAHKQVCSLRITACAWVCATWARLCLAVLQVVRSVVRRWFVGCVRAAGGAGRARVHCTRVCCCVCGMCEYTHDNLHPPSSDNAFVDLPSKPC